MQANPIVGQSLSPDEISAIENADWQIKEEQREAERLKDPRYRAHKGLDTDDTSASPNATAVEEGPIKYQVVPVTAIEINLDVYKFDIEGIRKVLDEIDKLQPYNEREARRRTYFLSHPEPNFEERFSKDFIDLETYIPIADFIDDITYNIKRQLEEIDKKGSEYVNNRNQGFIATVINFPSERIQITIKGSFTEIKPKVKDDPISYRPSESLSATVTYPEELSTSVILDLLDLALRGEHGGHRIGRLEYEVIKS